MTHKQTINAYGVLMKLGTQSMDVRTALSLYKLRKELEGAHQFCAEREEVIIEKYHGTLGDVTISFPQPQDAIAAQAELTELYQMEAELEVTPLSIPMNVLDGCKLTPNDLEALEGIINLI